MARLVFLVPGSGDSSLAQEECCWWQASKQTPALALNSIAYLRRKLGCDSVKVCRPNDLATGTRAMTFSWIFGEQLEAAARLCSVLIANPSSTAAAVRERFPAAQVVPACEVFDADNPLDFGLLDDWPHPFTGVLYQATSGCPHRCPYCPWAHRHLRRNPKLAAREIRELLSRYPSTADSDVAVLCNEITGVPHWLGQFCLGLGYGVKWRSDGNVRNATRPDLETAARHGLVELTLGVEALEDSLLRTCGKGHTVEDAFRVFRWCQDLGIRYRFSLRQRIGETPEQLDRQLASLLGMQALGLRPSKITVGPMDAWPGNDRWKGSEPHGSRSYPRLVKPWGSDAAGIIARWKLILATVPQVQAD